jgi:excisionase family DNA binding protein
MQFQVNICTRSGSLQAMKNGSEHPQSLQEAAWISYSEAQRYTGLGRTKLWELVSAGDVEAARIGRAVRISRRSLDEYMKRNRYVAVDR